MITSGNNRRGNPRTSTPRGPRKPRETSPPVDRTSGSVGEEIIEGPTEAVEIPEAGGRPEDRPDCFPVRTLRMPDDPNAYDAAAVKTTRRRLGANQAVFARLVGVSVRLVQAWETGGREPSLTARRLMDEFNRDPRRWADALAPR